MWQKPRPAFSYLTSHIMDNNITKNMQAFLQVKNPTDQQIKDAALLLLQIAPNRYRGIYNTASKRPQAMLPWVVTELKKQLDIRQRGLDASKVEAYNEETLKRAKETLSTKPEGVQIEEKQTFVIPILGGRGKRTDHDKLPEHIQQLWDDNGERWKRMRQIHTQLSLMISKPGYAACDGNELCYQLRQLDDAVRADYKKYDSYQIGEKKEAPAKKDDSVDAFTDNLKAIQKARTAINRGLNKKSQTQDSLKKIQEAVNKLYELKQVVKKETADRLKAIGINIPANA